MKFLKSGKLIVIDGTDGSGKATQTKLLVEKLKVEGYAVEVTDFPQYGKKSAALVEEYLNGVYGSPDDVGPYRASIFYASDRYAASDRMKAWLGEGRIIISNRYVSSNMGHQGGKITDPTTRKKFLDWLYDLEFGIFGIPKPDLNILLYMPPEVGQGLVEKKLQATLGSFMSADFEKKVAEQKSTRSYLVGKTKDIHELDINHLRHAAQVYLEIARDYPGWVRIDCTKNRKILSPNEIHGMVHAEVQKILTV
jgi:dTMP kinase